MNRFNFFLEEYGLDALLIVGHSNVLYSTGYLADFCYVVVTSDISYYLTDGRFTLEAKDFLDDSYKIIDCKPSNVLDKIKEILDNCSCVTLGMDNDIPHLQYADIEKGLVDYKVVNVTQKMLDTRMIKDSEEIALITKAQRIAEKSLDMLLKELCEGITERIAMAKLDYYIRMNGGSNTSFDTIMAFGSNSAYAHAKPSDRALIAGDIILIDFGVLYRGYRSDMTRTFFYKSVTARQRELYNSVLSTNISSIKYIKAGQSSDMVDINARATLKTFGVDELFNHSLGHGIGVDIHERPYLSSERNTTILTEGMVVTIEPGIYIEGFGGIRIEDMIVITDNGATNLTTFDKTLRIIK